ncbi:MAG: DUF1636 domain-containing protein [Hyphomicrobiaceae bacterium]
MTAARMTTISVCTMCGDESGLPEDAARCPGRLLFDRLSQLIAGQYPSLTVKSAPCMAVCERPVTVAFQAAGAWGYVIAGVDADRHIDDVVATAFAIASSQHGIPAMADRPLFFQEGVVCRVPPIA